MNTNDQEAIKQAGDGKKPMKPRPHVYACIFPSLLEIARSLGYNLVLHGSLDRDMDVVAIPWVDKPEPHLELLQQFEKYLTGVYHDDIDGYHYTMLPGNRYSYFININRGGRFNNYLDEQYYLDISITPLINSEAAKNYWLNELGKQQGDGWISVEERLPEKDNEEYLVFGCEVVSTLNWIKGKWYSDVLEMFVGNDSITHWRPLPQPPNQ